ncbi:pentapeptide repeat-containing protein [Bradyrhizobium sp. 179]|uniref:pentapeptide repeat-containing protein n=1 Tax=Bradyrhizobium sp. 179 TaxID=2782648 RepID=UPI001FFA10F6|nr:pentapeptide repeat-containing protein [Bradyrhizobium sp. 179]MCK1547163.1 pentapeptide repeat-containing protein [Bradyrhizobium sp. 179]
MIEKSAALYLGCLRRRGHELSSFLQRSWIVLTFFALVVLFFFVSTATDPNFWAERTFDSHGSIKEVKFDGMKIAQQVALFLLALIGLALAIWRSITSHRQATASLEQAKTAIKQAEIASKQAETASKQAEIAENNQRFDRYARAAQLLDNEKSAVRQAGIYLLRELAIGDEKYRSLCAELLASFIRSHNTDALDALVPLKDIEAMQKLADKATPAEIVDAFKSICRTRPGGIDTVNLQGIVLSQFRLDHRDQLVNLNLNHSYLNQPQIYGLEVRSCELARATFRFGTFHQVNFEGNDLYETNFHNMDFEDVRFRDTRFWNCSFNNCTFKDCDMSGAAFVDDLGDLAMPFDVDALKDSWAWQNNLPRLSGKFAGAVYDPGPGNKYRNEFARAREKRRVSGNIFAFTPDESWKIL